MWSVRDEGEHRGLLTMAGPLVGRDAELAAVLRSLADPAVRAVVLAGPSGVGKTKLALTACESSAADQVVFVPLSPVREGDVMADAVVAAIGAAGALSERPPDALWRSYSGRRCCGGE